MRRLLLLTAALIVYGSLYPWRFGHRTLIGDPLAILLHSWPAPLSRSDVRDALVNLALYSPLGFFGFLVLREWGRRTVAAIVPVAASFALSCAIELTQLYVPGRVTSALDVLDNTVGSVLGVGVAALLGGVAERGLKRRGARLALHPPAALLLAYLWIAAQIFPLFPDASRTRLLAKVHGLAAFPPIPAFSAFTDWLAVSALLDAVFGASVGSLLSALTVLLAPSKIAIATRSTNLGEMAGALLGVALWRFWAGRKIRPYAAAAALLGFAIVLRDFTPFVFTAVPRPFLWTPFAASLTSDALIGLGILLEKAFWYGTAVWLLARAGWPLPRAALTVAISLAAVEIGQRFSVMHTAEITDPLLALLMAGGIALAEKRFRDPAAAVSGAATEAGFERP